MNPCGQANHIGAAPQAMRDLSGLFELVGRSRVARLAIGAE
jgi:hypothetical protein